MTWSRASTRAWRSGRSGCSRRPAASPGSGIGHPTRTHHASAHPGEFEGRAGVAERVSRALVLTISDGVASGTRQDESGDVLASRLQELGYSVGRLVVADEPDAIAELVTSAADSGVRLVMSTGGTGLGPRDQTPQALAIVLDYQIPGFGEVMRAAGRRSTPLADLSRSFAGVAG